jgi:hypothetical protein
MRLPIISPLLQNFISYHHGQVFYRGTTSATVVMFGAKYFITVFEPGEWLLSTSRDYTAVLRKGAGISQVRRLHTVRVDDAGIIRVMKSIYRDTYGKESDESASR